MSADLLDLDGQIAFVTGAGQGAGSGASTGLTVIFGLQKTAPNDQTDRP